jgi:ABC-2 type transport system permease protein
MIDIVRAAFVIARRDFTAIVFSKTFIFFLLGPLFPLVIGMAFGGLGEKISTDALRPVVGIAMPGAEAARMERGHAILVERLGPQTLPELKRLSPAADPAVQLAQHKVGVVAIVSGTVDHPVLTGKPDDIAMLKGDVSLIASAAAAGGQLPRVNVRTRAVLTSTGAQDQARLLTARAGQALIFLLTMLLAGMVLSNMVEEKTTKVIEVLAAAVPVDAIFLGKLAAMLAMSFVGIAFWGSGAVGLTLLLVGPGGFSMPAPAVGWPLFVTLGVLYFTMAYLLLGSLFLGIGAQAATVREVQTLNMPVTMAQLLIFFFATYAVDHMGSPAEVAATIFPFSSPFAMIARAAQQEALWPHFIALVWQGLAVVVIIRLGVFLFRRHVLKSGNAGGRLRWRDLFRRAKG